MRINRHVETTYDLLGVSHETMRAMQEVLSRTCSYHDEHLQELCRVVDGIVGPIPEDESDLPDWTHPDADGRDPDEPPF